MLHQVPLNLTLERPGSADWRSPISPEAPAEVVDYLAERTEYHAEVEVTVAGESLAADVFTDDEAMNAELQEYFKLNTALREQNGITGGTVIEARPKIVYLTENGLNIDGDVIGQAGLPYEGLFDAEGHAFVAAGRKSIGTFKSMVIGAMSGVLAARRPMVPTHAAIVQTPDGRCAGFSGRGNTGKTTSLLSTFERLKSSSFRVVTDDWSMIDERTREVHPVDFLVSIRPESLPGLADIYTSDWVDDFTTRVLDFEKSKSKSKPLGISDVYGEASVGATGVLESVVFTSLTKLFLDEDGEHVAVNFKEVEQAATMGHRLRDDAYHAPELQPEFTHEDFETRYRHLAGNLACALVFTREEGPARQEQAQKMANWIEASLA